MRGRIKKALSGFYYVDTGEEVVTCRARGRFRKEGVSPLVGDRVEITVSGTEGMVDAIEPRRNVFSRPAVANIDQLVIVASNAIPQTDPYLIDRMTAIAALKGCEVLICINKSDLDHADELCAIYAASLKYYKVDYVPISDRMYYEYADELLRHIRELVELENGINFTGNEEIAIVLTDEELEIFLDDEGICKRCRKLYMGHDVLLDAQQAQALQEYNIAVNVIPDYYYKELEG